MNLHVIGLTGSGQFQVQVELTSKEEHDKGPPAPAVVGLTLVQVGQVVLGQVLAEKEQKEKAPRVVVAPEAALRMLPKINGK